MCACQRAETLASTVRNSRGWSRHEGRDEGGVGPPATRISRSLRPWGRSTATVRVSSAPARGGRRPAVEPGLDVGLGVEDEPGLLLDRRDDRDVQVDGLATGRRRPAGSGRPGPRRWRRAGARRAPGPSGPRTVAARSIFASGSKAGVRPARPAGRRPGTGRRCSPAGGARGRRAGRPGRRRSSSRPGPRASARPR